MGVLPTAAASAGLDFAAAQAWPAGRSSSGTAGKTAKKIAGLVASSPLPAVLSILLALAALLLDNNLPRRVASEKKYSLVVRFAARTEIGSAGRSVPGSSSAAPSALPSPAAAGCSLRLLLLQPLAAAPNLLLTRKHSPSPSQHSAQKTCSRILDPPPRKRRTLTRRTQRLLRYPTRTHHSDVVLPRPRISRRRIRWCASAPELRHSAPRLSSAPAVWPVCAAPSRRFLPKLTASRPQGQYGYPPPSNSPQPPYGYGTPPPGQYGGYQQVHWKKPACVVLCLRVNRRLRLSKDTATDSPPRLLRNMGSTATVRSDTQYVLKCKS